MLIDIGKIASNLNLNGEKESKREREGGGRETDRQTHWETPRNTGRHRKTDKQADRQADMQTDRQTGRQTSKKISLRAATSIIKLSSDGSYDESSIKYSFKKTTHSLIKKKKIKMVVAQSSALALPSR